MKYHLILWLISKQNLALQCKFMHDSLLNNDKMRYLKLNLITLKLFDIDVKCYID
jgi:hypothetical protein